MLWLYLLHIRLLVLSLDAALFVSFRRLRWKFKDGVGHVCTWATALKLSCIYLAMNH